VEDDDFAHALGSNWLSGFVQSRRENKEVLRECGGRLGFHCNLRPAPAMCSPVKEGKWNSLCERSRVNPLWSTISAVSFL
jgi:hypothetical protein